VLGCRALHFLLREWPHVMHGAEVPGQACVPVVCQQDWRGGRPGRVGLVSDSAFAYRPSTMHNAALSRVRLARHE
jgi:hypothetical protein